MNNETWLKTKGIPISQVIKEGMQCYAICQNIDAYCKGVLSGIEKVNADYIAVWKIRDVLEDIQNITKQAKFTYYEKIEKEENDNEK